MRCISLSRRATALRERDFRLAAAGVAEGPVGPTGRRGGEDRGRDVTKAPARRTTNLISGLCASGTPTPHTRIRSGVVPTYDWPPRQGHRWCRRHRLADVRDGHTCQPFVRLNATDDLPVLCDAGHRPPIARHQAITWNGCQVRARGATSKSATGSVVSWMSRPRSLEQPVSFRPHHRSSVRDDRAHYRTRQQRELGDRHESRPRPVVLLPRRGGVVPGVRTDDPQLHPYPHG